MNWRRVWKEISTWGSLVLLLAVFGGVVWATNHPDHPLLARAAGWPAVGPWVERFRASYGIGIKPVAAPVGEPEGEDGAETAAGDRWVYVPAEEGARGRPSAAAPILDLRELAAPGPEQIWVAAGEEVRDAPSASARRVVRQRAFERLEVLERRGDWARVASDAGEGWVHVEPGEDVQYPLGEGLRPTVPLPGARPDSAELIAARELMGVEGPAGRLGDYTLFTDVQPPSRLFRLDRVARQAEPVYRQRYGRPLAGEAAEAVLVFEREATYRLYQVREARLQGLPAAGHSGRGLVAFWVGGRPPHEQDSTLLHELGHVLNRRAVGPALPSWLDEGMAEDLSLSAVTEDGEVRPERLGGLVVRQSSTGGRGRIEYAGAVAALRNLNSAFARVDAPKLEDLVELGWEDFVRGERGLLHYAVAGFFIRYLVEDPELAPGFRRFLDQVAEGGPASGEALRRELGRSWQQLDDGLAEWVRGKILETTLEARGSGAQAGEAEAPRGGDRGAGGS